MEGVLFKPSGQHLNLEGCGFSLLVPSLSHGFQLVKNASQSFHFYEDSSAAKYFQMSRISSLCKIKFWLDLHSPYWNALCSISKENIGIAETGHYLVTLFWLTTELQICDVTF